MSRKKRIRDHYGPRIVPGRDHHEILDWASAASQEVRFRVLVENVPLEGASLLDVGAGLGDLWAYLKRRGVKANYTGVDILEDMARAARQRHGDARFVCADLFDPAAECPFAAGSFDVVFCSGTFNLNLGNNLQFVPAALSRLIPLSRRWVVFNMLHCRARGPDRRYFYYDPEEVVAMVRPYGCEVRVVDDYLANDFTVVCLRGGA